MWLTKVHLLVLLICCLASIRAIERPKAFGHTIEYRYEYDPIKGKEPIVHWKYDNLNGQSKEGIVYPRELHDVRKSPVKFANKMPYVSREEMEPLHSYQYNKMYRRHEWTDDQPIENREEAAERTRELTDAMSSFLREESKMILAQHFPNFPFAFGPIPRQYGSRFVPREHHYHYPYLEERPFI